MVPFVSRFPDLAARETRVLLLPHPQCGLPSGSYGFVEWYCADPACDCRRVLFQVCEERRPSEVLATINFGWERAAFYADWLHGDEKGAKEIVEASLDPLNRQSSGAPALLLLFRELLIPDEAYVARLRRHYELFKRRTPGASQTSRTTRRPPRT